MPKSAVKSYEDWTPPKFLQGEDEDIDLERVKLEFYTRESENHRYREQNRALKSQISDLREQVEAPDEDGNDERDDKDSKSKAESSKGKGQGPSLTEIRLKIALEKGLTYNQAMRLHGENEDELKADAEVYMEEHGISTGRDDEGGDDEGEEAPSSKPPQRQPRRGDVKSGSERGDDDLEPSHFDPAKFLDQV